MARAEWKRDIDQAVRHEPWSLTGPNRLVKVTPALPTGVHSLLPTNDLALNVCGYITMAKSIKGKTPNDIERALGLEVKSLESGAIISELCRKPAPSEYVYELTTDRPDGLAPTFASSDKYPPGDKRIHQWRIVEGAVIPTFVARQVRLSPGQRFQG